jgi:predicted Fe-Mo cluster-binding NifX family protein
MKIAIPINNRSDMSAHFGRSPAFLVFSVENGQVQHREVRVNDQATPGTVPDHPQGHLHAHDHNRFAQLLGDCQALIGLGMGAGARLALEGAGIKVRLLAGPCPPEEAALRFESGLLEVNPGTCCSDHGHSHRATK